jgi:hypothetical protein
MPLVSSVPPAAVTAAAEQACHSTVDTAAALGGGNQFLESFAAGGPPPNELAAPAPVYNLDLVDVVGPKGLKGARRVGWRHLVLQGDSVIAATEVPEASARQTPSAAYEESSYATNCPLALEAAEALEEVAKHDFEVRMLRIPALSTMALWLHGTAGDLLIPLSNQPTGDVGGLEGVAVASDDGLQPNVRYTAGDYLNQLRPQAQELLAYDRLPATRKLYGQAAKPRNTTKTLPPGGPTGGKAGQKKVGQGKVAKTAAKKATGKAAKKTAAPGKAASKRVTGLQPAGTRGRTASIKSAKSATKKPTLKKAVKGAKTKPAATKPLKKVASSKAGSTQSLKKSPKPQKVKSPKRKSK